MQYLDKQYQKFVPNDDHFKDEAKKYFSAEYDEEFC